MATKVTSGKTRRALFWAARLGVVGVVLVAVEVAPGNWVPSMTLAPTSEVVKTLTSWVLDGEFYGAVLTTAYHALVGLSVGLVVGSAAAGGMWFLGNRASWVEPYAAAIHSVPRIALLPLLFVWIASRDLTILTFVSVSCSFIFFYTVWPGLKSIDRVTLGSLLVMGANSKQLARHYLIPHARTFIVTGLFIAGPNALVTALVGEMLLGKGLGGLLILYRGRFDVPGLYAATFAAALLGVGMTFLAGFLSRRTVSQQSLRSDASSATL